MSGKPAILISEEEKAAIDLIGEALGMCVATLACLELMDAGTPPGDTARKMLDQIAPKGPGLNYLVVHARQLAALEHQRRGLKMPSS